MPSKRSVKQSAIIQTVVVDKIDCQKFAHEDITHTLMTYLTRYHEFVSPDQMKRVVNLLHRQAVKAKAEGLFFKVSVILRFCIFFSKTCLAGFHSESV